MWLLLLWMYSEESTINLWKRGKWRCVIDSIFALVKKKLTKKTEFRLKHMKEKKKKNKRKSWTWEDIQSQRKKAPGGLGWLAMKLLSPYCVAARLYSHPLRKPPTDSVSLIWTLEEINNINSLWMDGISFTSPWAFWYTIASSTTPAPRLSRLDNHPDNSWQRCPNSLLYIFRRLRAYLPQRLHTLLQWIFFVKK